MPTPAILVNNLSKKYLLKNENEQSRVEALSYKIKHLLSKEPQQKQYGEFWALKNISFELNRGDILGIIGKNGSGKSTLLSILSGITQPTDGKVEISGNYASILEVGTGFHPDLTGRENIFLNGVLLGIKKKKIEENFDEIVAFSGVEKFINMPVKHYSNGMYLRLAASIAFHVDVEILLFDEVLSVGDIEFKHKALVKMKSMAAGGTTIVMVSHNINDVLQLCNKCMFLDKGELRSYDAPGRSIAKYLACSVLNTNYSTNSGSEKESTANEECIKIWENPENAPGTDNIKLKQITVKLEGKEPKGKILIGDPFEIEIQLWKLKTDMTVQLHIIFFDQLDNPIFSSTIFYNKSKEDVFQLYSNETGLYKITCQIPGDLLYKGRYSFQIIFGRNLNVEEFIFNENVYFTIHPNPQLIDYVSDSFPIAVRPVLLWKHEKVAPF